MSNFLISFDYELMWGLYQRTDYSYIHSNVVNSNLVVKEILKIHREHSIPATWAVVGIAADEHKFKGNVSYFFKHIFNNTESKNESEFKELLKNKCVSLYGAVIDEIIADEDQELASHSYFHVFFDKFNSKSSVIEDDFNKFTCLANTLGVKVVSMITPKNIYQADYSEVISNQGIRCLRINPDNFLYNGFSYKKPNRLIRILRALDYYMPVNEVVDLIPQIRAKPSLMPDSLIYTEATLFLRGSGKSSIVNWLVYFRCVLAIRYRVFRRQDVHFWTHPHNFGKNIDESLYWYSKVILYVKSLEKAGKIKMKNMEGLVGDKRRNE